MCERLVDEVADLKLDVRVIAMLGLDDGECFGAVGQRRVVTPGREQLCLRADETDAADDQPLPVDGGLGDLRLPSLGVVGQRNPCILSDHVDRGQSLRGQPHADRVQHALAGEPDTQRPIVKPGVGTQQDLPRWRRRGEHGRSTHR